MAAGAGSGGAAQTIPQVWASVVEQIKKEVIAPSLLRALERTVPVVWEDPNFVVGLGVGDGQHMAPLNSSEHRGAIERALRAQTGRPDLNLRIIEGTESSDWAHAKARDAAAKAQQQRAVQQHVAAAGAAGSWEELYDQVQRLWANSDHRSLASGKGRFLDQALEMVSQALDTLSPADGATTEQTERGLSRVVERIASMTSSDGTIVAYLLTERRRKEKAG